MLENRIAIIEKANAGADMLALEIEDRIKKQMDIFQVKGSFYGWYDLYMWDHKVMELTPRVITDNDEYEEQFCRDYKNWKGIIILVDGEAFAVAGKDKDEYKLQVRRRLIEMGQLDLLRVFAEADKSWKMPPVCINVTKSDVIEECWNHLDWVHTGTQEERGKLMTAVIDEIIRESYKLFFDDTFTDTHGVMISRTAIRRTGDTWHMIAAENIEQVMFFMIYSAFAVVMYERRKEWDAAMQEYQRLEGKLFKPEKIRQRMYELLEVNNRLKGDSYYIRKAADTISEFWEDALGYYVPGIQQSAKSYLWVMTSYYDFNWLPFSKYKERYFDGIYIS